ncbi:MAG: hypothetical protein K6E50_00340 [Lachnospiraceae bacterium]|nr:hypothetical protein [Lachnospiraceae bacterium]
MKHKTTITFVGIFLLAGGCYLCSRTGSAFFNSLMFCMNATLLLGLVVFWMYTVSARLLKTRTRLYISAAGFFIALFVMMRIFKYRIVVNGVIASRYVTYLYYIPRIMIPTLFLITAVRLAGDRTFHRHLSRGILVTGCALMALPLTNDLHGFVYRPKVVPAQFDMTSRTYSWGPGFFLLYAWIISLMVVGLIVLFAIMRKRDKKLVVMLVFTIVLWLSAKLFTSLVIDRLNTARMYSGVEIDCFSMLLLLECCIRSRLIPYNENYAGFFHSLSMPVLITGPGLDTVYASSVPVRASKETLASAEDAPVYLDEDTRLMCMKIRAGYTFWTEDESELHKEQRRLADANAVLSEENDLIALERRLKEQKAQLEAQALVYEKIGAAMAPKQKKIRELLNATRPDAADFADALGKVCVLNAYSKRKTNLLLLSEEALPKQNRELFLALSESARFLNCCGIDAAAVGEEYSGLPLSDVHELYDTFETLIEAYLPVLREMTVSIMPEGIRVAMEAETKVEIAGAVLPVTCVESDGLLFFTIKRRNAGGGVK